MIRSFIDEELQAIDILFALGIHPNNSIRTSSVRK
jgi:hypothetical protein